MTKEEQMEIVKDFDRRYYAGETMTAKKYFELCEIECDKFYEEHGYWPDENEALPQLTEQEDYEMLLEFMGKLAGNIVAEREAKEEKKQQKRDAFNEKLDRFAEKTYKFFDKIFPVRR